MYYLAHHGIKGQRWGVRRFEGTNGKLTAAGKKRYLTKEEKKAAKKAKRQKELAEWRKPWDEASKSNKRKRIALIAGSTLVAALIKHSAKAYFRGKAYVQANNAVVDAYAKTHGLREVAGPPILGFKQVNNGKKIMNTILGG